MAPDAVPAELLDRSGKVLPLPVAASIVDKDFVRWARAELVAGAARGGRLRAAHLVEARASEQIVTLAPFQDCSLIGIRDSGLGVRAELDDWDHRRDSGWPSASRRRSADLTEPRVPSPESLAPT